MGPNGVLEQLSKGAVGALDEVSLTGGPWRPLFQHADFRPYFFPGEEQLTQSKAERKRKEGNGSGMTSDSTLSGLGLWVRLEPVFHWQS